MKKAAKIAAVCAAAALAATIGLGAVGCGGNYTDPNTLFTDMTGLTVDGNAVTFSEKKMTKLFKDGEAEGGFAVSYTVQQGDETDYNWMNSGGLYVELDGETVDIDGVPEPLFFNVVIFQDNPNRGDATMDANASVWITENSSYTHAGTEDGAHFDGTNLSFMISRNPMKVTIAYYHEAYYFSLDNTSKFKLTAESDFKSIERAPDLEKFFAAGKRKLGFRSAMTPATFSKISLSLGDEAARAAIQKMGFKDEV